MLRTTWTLLFGALALAACGDDDRPADAGSPDAGTPDATVDMAVEAAVDMSAPDGDPPEEFTFTTDAFSEGDMIPLRYECGRIIEGPGENISPALMWTAGPEGTASYAMVMDDVDSGVVHWVVYDIPVDVRGLRENFPAAYMPLEPDGAKQAEIQGTDYFGYFGPCSPGGINTYRWTLHAMPTATLTGATMETTEYEARDLIEAQSTTSLSFSGES